MAGAFAGRLLIPFASVLVLAGASHASGKSPWLSPGQFDRLHVVLAADAPEPEQIAARRFVEHWRLRTGFVSTQSAEPSSSAAANVWIGAAAREAFPSESKRRLRGANDFFVLTVSRKSAGDDERHLLLTGADPRGTLNAEWAFFERYLGARAYAPDMLIFPEPEQAIPAIDWRGKPVFEYRDTNYRAFLTNPWLASLNDLNGQWSNVPDRFGGHIGFVHGLAGHGHTFHHFVNPEEYFDTHPEYFAEIGGERIKEAQLCLTNPDVLAITIDRARRYLREAAPGERVLSISQMDYYWFDSWCSCAYCAAVDKAEESHSGTIIRFVNAVADAVKDEFPEALIDTFAYFYSIKPPKLTRPRDNVLVRVCAIEADYARPLSDRTSPDNRAFVRHLKGWRNIAKHVWVWDYTQNWRAFQAPHPNLPVLQPNLALFARIGVNGVFEQASPHSPHSDFEYLKAYLIGRGLRDPHFDWKREVAAFNDAYYGAAAPFIGEYLALLDARLQAWGGPLYFTNDLDWIDAKTVERAQEIFARAFAAVHDETITARLRSVYLPLQFAALVCPPDVELTSDAYVFTRPPSQTFDEYWATLEALGVTYLNDYPINRIRTRLGSQTPPRSEVAPIVKLLNDKFEAWVVPARGGSIVRWREVATGREWLDGYTGIKSAAGRIQDWATTDDDRWAEPEPNEQAYEIEGQADRHSVSLKAQLNGLLISKKIELTDSGIDVSFQLLNTSPESVAPKMSLVADFATADLRRPRVWQRKWETLERAPMRADVSKLPPENNLWLRFPRIERNLGVVIHSDLPGDQVKAYSDEQLPLRVDAALDREPIAPNTRRELTVHYSLGENDPPPIVIVPNETVTQPPSTARSP